jgi:hypothetical protein
LEQKTFGSVRKEFKQLKSELETLRSASNRTAPSHMEIKISDQLVELYHHEEITWKQRSRVEWLFQGIKILATSIKEPVCGGGRIVLKI